MQYIHVKNLEKYHPGYKDRTLQWAKIFINMASGDPDTEELDETDWARLVKLILLELRAQKPLPLTDKYLSSKGFKLKKRPMSMTIQMLHNFIVIVTDDLEDRHVDKIREDKEKIREEGDSAPEKFKFLDHVLLTQAERTNLTEKLGEKNSYDYIERLNNYILQIGIKKAEKYKSHYATILNWSKKDGIKAPVKQDDPLKKYKEMEKNVGQNPEDAAKIQELIKQTAKSMK